VSRPSDRKETEPLSFPGLVAPSERSRSSVSRETDDPAVAFSNAPARPARRREARGVSPGRRRARPRRRRPRRRTPRRDP
jgi:hypothetical protein